MVEFSSFTELGTVSPELRRALEIAARCRLNILISGGTGSGKTTLLNALSRMIDRTERIITIEDAAELQLQQPHVIQLETRPANIEGQGQVTQRDLARNSLRMRPDRIIIGEVRGPEAFDMMQAMNTGHNGSMSTVHANSARDSMARIENMVLMANLKSTNTRHSRPDRQRHRLDCSYRAHARWRSPSYEVMQVAGLEEDTILLGKLFTYKYVSENPDGTLNGVFKQHPRSPGFSKDWNITDWPTLSSRR